MGNVSRDMAIPRRNLKEILEIKSSVTDIKNDFDDLKYVFSLLTGQS